MAVCVQVRMAVHRWQKQRTELLGGKKDHFVNLV